MALDFFAGCLGGCAGILVGHPFDTVKVHLQTQDFRNPKYRGTLHCFQSIIQKETVWGLYRGISSPLAAVAVVNAIVFGVYGNTQRHMADPDSLSSHLLAGSTAGLVQSFVCSPMELTKTRSQLQAGSPFSCLLGVVREGGVRGLYKGLGITITREVPGYGVYFLAYEAMTRGADHLGTPHMLLAGGLSGVASWLTTYPADVVKSRLQADTEGRYSGAVDCLRKSVAHEGLSVLTRGLTSTLLRAFPTNAATFAVVTWVMRSFADVPRDGAAAYHTPLRSGEFVTLGVGAYALDDVGQHVSTAWSSFLKAAPRIFHVQHVSCGSCVVTPSESQLEEDQVRAVLLACELSDDVHCSCKAVKQKPSSLNQSCCCVCSEPRIMAAGGEGQALFDTRIGKYIQHSQINPECE